MNKKIYPMNICAVYDGLSTGLAIGDIFTSGLEGEAKGIDHLERASISGAGMREIAIVRHIL